MHGNHDRNKEGEGEDSTTSFVDKNINWFDRGITSIIHSKPQLLYKKSL